MTRRSRSLLDELIDAIRAVVDRPGDKQVEADCIRVAEIVRDARDKSREAGLLWPDPDLDAALEPFGDEQEGGDDAR